MSHKKRERKKLFVLIVLVLMSFIQVGILYQNQGLPSNFLWGIFNSSTKAINYDISDYLKPYKVIVSDAYMSHWIIDESYDYYEEIWEDAKYYIQKILSNNVIKQESFNDWGQVAIKESIIFDFKTRLSADLLSDFLKTKISADFQMDGIYKMAVVPNDDINNNVTVFLYDNNAVRKYVLPFNARGLGRDHYDSIIYNLQKDKSLQSYYLIKETVPNLENIKQDVLVVTGSNIYREYKEINCKAPEEISNISLEPDSGSDLEEIADKILGRDKESYERGFDEVNRISVFRTLSNTFRLYMDGLLEYKFIDKVEKTDAIDESEAFEEAAIFIEARKSLLSGVEIYLSEISNNGSYYTFCFDYKFKGVPVFFNEYSSITRDKTLLNHAITIKANSTRVLECYWIFKDFSDGDKVTLRVNNFAELMEEAVGTYKELNTKGSYVIKDISISYSVTDAAKAAQTLKPVWFIETVNGKNYAIPMLEKGAN